MELKIVSFELAKKLKEIGFDIHIDSYYLLTDTHKYDPYREQWNRYDNRVSAPTQALAQMWFRKEYNIVINLTEQGTLDYPIYGTEVFLRGDDEDAQYGYLRDGDIIDFKTYEEALEAGLLKACEIIKEKQNGNN